MNLKSGHRQTTHFRRSRFSKADAWPKGFASTKLPFEALAVGQNRPLRMLAKFSIPKFSECRLFGKQPSIAGKRWFYLLGYTKEELGNDEEDWLNLINPQDLERFSQKLAAHLQGETAC